MSVVHLFKKLVKYAISNKNVILPQKKNTRILFISTDNNSESGGFICMVNLIEILRNKYSLDTFVILPHEGTGTPLLEEKQIPYKIIYSLSWTTPLATQNNLITKIKIFLMKLLNKHSIRLISKCIRENDVDLIHINSIYSYVAAISSINEKTPFIWHLREFLEEDQGNALWDTKKGYNLINQADKVITISNSTYGKYKKLINEKKLVCIYDGIDHVKFYNPNKEIFNNDKLVFIMVGFFNYHKGQIELAEACSKLYSDGFTNFELWYVGGWNDENIKNTMDNAFNSAGMTNVKYLGHIQNVEDYYSKADISFTCSKSEAFGRITVEAMLSGNLVIGANSAGTKELLSNKRGLLFEPENSIDLYEKIKYAIKNPEMSKKIAEKGRKYMYEHMTAENNADEIYNVYNEILNNK